MSDPLDAELARYLASACYLADEYLECMEGVCGAKNVKLPPKFAEYKAIRKKMGEKYHG